MALVPIDGATLPTEGILSFGYQRTATHRHQGIDLHAKLGTPVRAAFAGVVDWALSKVRRGFSGYGRVVVVQGPGVWALYAHLDQVFVRKGEQVEAGQVIGTVGRTCFTVEQPAKLCNRPHLHFEVSSSRYPQASEATRLDPVSFLGDPWHPGLALAALIVLPLLEKLLSKRL